MKNVLLGLCIFILSFVGVYANDDELRVSDYYSKISEAKGEITLLGSKQKLLRLEYQNIIEEARQQIEINKQRAAHTCAKYHSASCNTQAIQEEGERELARLEAQLEYELSGVQGEIEEQGRLIRGYKDKIQTLLLQDKKQREAEQLEREEQQKQERIKKTEEKTKQKLVQKVEVIYDKLEKKVSKLDTGKKVKTYENIIVKLEKYKAKSKREDLNTIIDLLIEKMQNYISENTNIEDEIFNIINN